SELARPRAPRARLAHGAAQFRRRRHAARRLARLAVRGMTRKSDIAAAVVVIAVAVALWLPRKPGPIDLRWDAGVYYILGTSLAGGHGYRLLNEPGQIRALQNPPLPPPLVPV